MRTHLFLKISRADPMELLNMGIGSIALVAQCSIPNSVPPDSKFHASALEQCPSVTLRSGWLKSIKRDQ